MKERIHKAVHWVIYPWLLALYPVIYLYAVNLGDLREIEVGEVVLTMLLATTLVYALIYWGIRDIYKTGAITSVMVLIFLTYGHIYKTLDVASLKRTLLLPIMLCVGIGLIVLIGRSKLFLYRIAPSLNLIAVALLVMPVWAVANYTFGKPDVGATARANPLERVVNLPAVNNDAAHPDIYYIILDSYASNAFWLREYGYDNSAFTDALEERGFYVAYDSRSNYGVTIASLPSSLNMRYITEADRAAARRNDVPDRVYLRSLIANNRVAYELIRRGYTYIYMLSGYLSPSMLADENVIFCPEGPEYFSGATFNLNGRDGSWAYQQSFWPFFAETTLLRSLAADFPVEEHGEPLPRYSPQTVLATLAELQTIPSREEATFTFAHIIKPHQPIEFDRAGNIIEVDLAEDDPARVTYFFDELNYLNTRVLELVDYLLAESSVPPIIIIQGDHGSALGDPSPIMGHWVYFEILNALYLPDGGSAELDNSLSPVNTFRIIFNRYFGQNYELLDSQQYLVPDGWEQGDYFTYVQYVDDRRLNRDLGDSVALLYNSADDAGAPEFQIYSVTEVGEKGDFLLAVTQADVAPYLDNPPAQNTLIARQGAVAFYALTSGEFQFNLGPDAEGQEWAVIVDTLPARAVYGYQVGAE